MTFADKTDHNGECSKIGQWADLAAWYLHRDGSVWCYNASTYTWVKEANNLEDFKTVAKNRRGTFTL